MSLDGPRYRLALESLGAIQRAIASRAPLDEVLDAVVAAAEHLLIDENPALFLRDEDDPAMLRLAAHRIPADIAEEVARRPVGSGVGGRAVAEGRLIAIEDYAEQAEGTLPFFRDRRLSAAMAAPIRDGDDVIGALLISTYVPGRRYDDAEREVLTALATHAALAIQDARAVAAMTHHALHDPLTGLPNRALLADRLQHARDRARRHGGSVAVLFCDLDRFKAVNDSLGHDVGDDLLRQVAARIEHCLRVGDTAARLGGDEFAVLLEDIHDEAEARLVADRIVAELAPPFAVGGHRVFTGASVGIAIARAGDDVDLLRRADVAMYRAKADGRGRATLFRPAMQAEVVERVLLEADLDRALEADELEVHFQPIVELRRGEVRGFEALARWRHAERGLLGAGAFVPLAEDTGRLAPIGRKVLIEACTQFARWRARHPYAGLDTVSVNLSAGELDDPSIVAAVAGALAAAELPADCLMLELTESVLLEDGSRAAVRLEELARLGVRLAIDDFGTGFSVLRHLSFLPLQVLKIAKPFVDDLEVGGRAARLCSAIVDLATRLGLDIVAEGVEHPTQRALLESAGCLRGQGHLFSRARSAAEITALLDADAAPALRLGSRGGPPLTALAAP